ncbi:MULTISPECIES: aldose epimerase family protein [Oceanobacillus]|uniref:Aldose 1-epimerase n=1 Tax=Oceanobacillus kimchii TaxID=746691 RepID=A0ABQ5TLF2_9BACI|nr:MULTISPECIES: aldose epimerase family protein [Oceanobacillus]MBT2600796.1 galactose mutarotase [Oceanobacillus sp. ISL-74]MBT2650807.1 galactose mutarotase [Oceanobacillus sp. ISL-73]GLO66870.1 aldose 1-epimerase [Oceanobacillus kimchii]
MQIHVENVHKDWKQFTMVNDDAMEVSILNFGGIITRIITPDKHGDRENIVARYNNFDDYIKNPLYLGAIIGRVAGRIQHASFSIEDKAIHLQANEGDHVLHGGSSGFHQILWDVTTIEESDYVGIKLSHTSKEKEGDFPGNVNVTVTYYLNNQNELSIEYKAISDKQTPITLTNHSYFNLSGNLKQTIHEHEITLDSDHFLELDEELIPTGKIMDVDMTPFDFRSGHRLGIGLNQDFYQNKIVGAGYDHYFLFNHEKRHVVNIVEPRSGRQLFISTNQPGMVMYTSNSVDSSQQFYEGEAKKHIAVCFETQGSPASLHHDNLDTIILEASQPYQKTTTFQFGIF